MNAHNTFDAPAVVAPAEFTGARLDGETLTVTLPPKLVVTLEIKEDVPATVRRGHRSMPPSYSSLTPVTTRQTRL